LLPVPPVGVAALAIVHMPGQRMELLPLEQPPPDPPAEGGVAEIVQDYVEFILSRAIER
jgi:hypothetical protein